MQAATPPGAVVGNTELVKALGGEVPLTNALAEAHRLVQLELDKVYQK
jgi:hypothetical protein